MTTPAYDRFILEACSRRIRELSDELENLPWWRIFKRYEIIERLEFQFNIFNAHLGGTHE